MARKALSVALIGPDGAGKTTVARRLGEVLDLPVHYLYMGVNLEASTRMLPTTRLLLALKRMRGGRPDMVVRSAGSGKRASRGGPLRTLKSAVRTTNWIAEEWYRQWVAWRFARQGGVVVFDRHFLPDYYAHDVVRVDPARPLASRIHGYVLRRYPRPDLAILLDASPEVLRARKPESTLAFLRQRRREYADMSAFAERSAVVDASQPLDRVLHDVAEVIRSAYQDVPAEAA